ncbi:hypothetical protein SeMB42_g04847 [Synchytrium endobioticum]|uniref:Uncharacterized protein n=2 Tax=Synchytrium endobioticum TaxID=286115 RepID=A0A507CVE3_9FUNG|nr:hypothetical protein SeMB42_g04847 [Synchytrium endobioticum]
MSLLRALSCVTSARPPAKKKISPKKKNKILGRRDCGAHHSSTVANMLTLFILISILLLQPSHAVDTEPTMDQLNAWRDEIRQFRYDLVNLDQKEQDERNDRLNKVCMSREAVQKYTGRREFKTCFYGYDEYVLAGLLIAEIVPEGAPLTWKSLEELPKDLSQNFLELYWECYETIRHARDIFYRYVYPNLNDHTRRFPWLYSGMQMKCQEQLLQNILPPIVGPTDSRIKNCNDVSACNMLLAEERARKTERLKQLQDSGVSVVSSLTQARVCTLDTVKQWCEMDSRIELSAHESQIDSEPTMESLIYLVNYNALVAQKLALIHYAVSRFVDDNISHGSWEEYDIGVMRESPDWNETHLPLDIETHLKEVDFELEIFPTGGVNDLNSELGIFLQLRPDDLPRKYLKLAEKIHLLRLRHSIHDDTVADLENRKALYLAFHTASLSYRKEQTCMLEKRLTRDTETYLAEVAFEFKKSTNKGVPFDFTELFPELGIFLKLSPSEVPPQYLELAEKVHSVHIEYLKSHDDGQLNALAMTTQRDEFNEPGVLYSAFHVAATAYGQTLERIQQSLETENIEDYLRKLKKYIDEGVPFDFASEFPQLGIFLQLHPSDVPPQYLELAEQVHVLSLGLFIPDEPVTDREYETTSRPVLCSPFHRVTLSELNHDNRNDVAYADLNRATITSNRELFPELGIFLKLSPSEVPPQYLELAEKVHSVHIEYLKSHDDGQLNALAMTTQRDEFNEPGVLYSAFHVAATAYGQTLERIQQSLETENIEDYLRKLKKTTDKGVPFDFTELFPELGIFLKLSPSEVPPQYLELAEKVHSVHIEYLKSHDDGQLNALAMTTQRDEFNEPGVLYSAFHVAATAYGQTLERIQQSLETENIEDYLRKLKKTTDKGVPFDFTELFPELGIFLKLSPSEVPPQYLELAEKVHSVHIEYLKSHDDGQLNALAMTTQRDEFNEPGVLYSAFHVAATAYGQTLERIQQSLETENIEDYLRKLKKYIDEGVPFDFASEFPQLGIFLQLHPSDVPPQYLELAEQVHVLSLGLFIPDEPVTDREYETTSRPVLCSPFHRVTLSELNHDNRNDVAYADLNRATITSNRGSGRRADIAGPPSSNSHGRVGCGCSLRSLRDRLWPRRNH